MQRFYMKHIVLAVLLTLSSFFTSVVANDSRYGVSRPLPSNTIQNNSCALRLFNFVSKYVSLPLEILGKYNTPTCYSFNFTKNSLDKLKKFYHRTAVPDFIKNIAVGNDIPVNKINEEAPQLIEWTSDKRAVLIPNTPRYHHPDDIVKRIKNDTLGELKNEKDGLTLSTWYMHPQLRRQAGLKNKKISISSLDDEEDLYLASPLDLKSSDVAHLKEIEGMIWDHLVKNYSVNEHDDVRIYYHFPYATKTTTFHLHIRVNQPTHDLEKAKSYSLRETINHLESGKSIEDLILKRQLELGGIFANRGGAEDFLEREGISEVNEVPNPFYNQDLN